jgi:hypothetical protein
MRLTLETILIQYFVTVLSSSCDGSGIGRALYLVLALDFHAASLGMNYFEIDCQDFAVVVGCLDLLVLAVFVTPLWRIDWGCGASRLPGRMENHRGCTQYGYEISKL